MIRINYNYIDRFKYFGNSYNYNVAPGLWLSFDKETLEYKQITLFIPIHTTANQIKVEQLCDEKINRLIALDILEVID